MGNSFWKIIWTSRDLVVITSIIIAVFSLFLVSAVFLHLEPASTTLVINSGLFIAIIATVFTYSKRKGIALQDIGFTNVSKKWMFLTILIGLGVMVIGGSLSSLLAKLLGLEVGNLSLMGEAMSDKMWLNLLNLKLLTAILLPVAEETFFRGVIFRYLRQNNTFIKSALISSLIFSLVHFDISVLPFTFLLGFVSAWVFEKTRSLISSFIVHITVNNLAVNFLLLNIF
ncbi:MAG TPA: type II CAAX endopeptidase family protein [Candidatus Paceibacterota bacterium]|jgi:hypothetical protein|nr:hypothetical protein [Parcubacteria group bacterium]MDP6119647.1 type II CAAX endopeptidase family protein [Candidatus Paceibacterota bacterium]HJN62745.1 type II CAAX endopeptidase family protein [Candidatus Paceibacterota bacterium]|tara:strand:- start:188 stop:871 length:684 start_codon:yes stop_codon:yes gene_type:complete